jgi:hypothetical protein
MSSRMRMVTGRLFVLILGFMVGVSFAQEGRGVPTNPDLTSSDVYFSSSMFQASIKSEKDLGALVAGLSTIGKQDTAFAFAGKSEPAKFFTMGSLYAEALAYLQGNNPDLAAKRLEAIEKEFVNLQAPSSLYNYLSKTRNMLVSGRYGPDVVGEFLALFQPLCEDFAKSRGEAQLTLFRAGSWLVDMSLTAAAGDRALLKQADKVQYFSQEMKRLNAPKGVMEALNKLTSLAAKPQLTDGDVNDILKLVQEIQTILA